MSIITLSRFFAGLRGESDKAPQRNKAANAKGLAPEALMLILDYEVGGGRSYYEARLARPYWSGDQGGVSIGVGYDLSSFSRCRIINDWHCHVTKPELNELLAVRRVTDVYARTSLRSVSHIKISWHSAFEVYRTRTLHDWAKRTRRTFPGCDRLSPLCFGALVSLVMNRGSSMQGEDRSEMRYIRRCISREDYSQISEALLRMKRLWSHLNQRGLHRRRDAESALIQRCVDLPASSEI